MSVRSPGMPKGREWRRALEYPYYAAFSLNPEPSMLGKIMARQLSRPDGLLGRVVARLMNRFNRAMSGAAIALLEVAPGDDVLEIGFGGGASLNPLLRA